MVGEEAQSGTQRWTFDSLFLADGLPLVPIVLGIFALPELCDLAIARTAVVTDGSMPSPACCSASRTASPTGS
jgi:TctA family transporter